MKVPRRRGFVRVGVEATLLALGVWFPAAAQDAVELRTADGAGIHQVRLSISSGGAAEVKLATTFNVQGHTLTGLAVPLTPSDAATKGYVDFLVAGLPNIFVQLQPLSPGALQMGNWSISGVGTLDRVRAGFGTAADPAVSLADDMNGDLGLYRPLPGVLGFAIGGVERMRLSAAGLNLEANPIVNLATPTSPQDAATKAYVDGLSAGGGVPSGHSILGSTTTPPAGFTYTGNYFTASGPGGGNAEWTLKAPMPTPRWYAAAGVVSGKIYVIGGSNVYGLVAANEEYDPVTNTWSSKAPMPTARYGAAAGVVNGRIYVIGGGEVWDPVTSSLIQFGTNEEFDPAANSWATRAAMPTPRVKCAAGVVNGKIYVLGGFGGGANLATNEMYDPSANSWTTKAPMPTPRNGLAAVEYGGKIYAFGGWNVSPYADAMHANEEYNPSTNAWATKPSIPGTGLAFLAGAALNQKIHIFALEHYAYDPATQAWESQPSMPEAGSAVAAATVNGKIYAIGGGSVTNSSTREFGAPVPVYYIHKKN